MHVTPALDQVIVLPYSDDLGVQQADARTLVTLLHVRDIIGEEPGGTAVVTELLDDRNRTWPKSRTSTMSSSATTSSA